MNNPLVSVIIPNYNHARFLDERIQTVLNQTYQNFELIILDDKSTDCSLEVINKYKNDPHVSEIVVNEENSGSTFKQWHKGFELAKGDIVWIAESDDSCDTKLLEVLVQGYLDSNAVLAFCKSCKYDDDGNRRCYMPHDKMIKSFSMTGHDFIKEHMIHGNIVANASSAIFNRQAALSVDRKYMSMRGEGDWLFWIELMQLGNVFFCKEELNYFRSHQINTTKSLRYRGVSHMEHKIVFDYLVNNGYIEHSFIWKERVRYLSFCIGEKYGSRAIRRKVLNIWDKNRLGRLYICARCFKRFLLSVWDLF